MDDEDTTPPPPPPPAEGDVYVGDIALRIQGKKRVQAIASVTVLNVDGLPVSGASVTGTWSGGSSNTETVTTDSNGIAEIFSARTAGSGTFTFTVNNIEGTGTSYNSNLNVETSESIPF